MSSERLRHGLRIAVGCAVGFWLASLLQLQAGQWVVITVVMVLSTEPRTGGILKKSLQRFWGTVLGAVAALLILFVLPGGPPWGLLWALPALVAFGYLAADAERAYIGVLGAVTLVMVAMEPDQNLAFALKRIAQIVLGLVVALGVGELVLPDHARTRLRSSVARVLQSLADLAAGEGERDALEVQLVTTLSDQRKLIGESLTEGEKAGRDLLDRLVIAERRAFRYLFILAQVPGNSPFLLQVGQGLQALAAGRRPEWPTAESWQDPVHRLAGERLLEACRSLDECLGALAGSPRPEANEPAHV